MGVKRGKREGGDKKSTKSLVAYLVRALWSVVCVRRRPGTKGFQERLLSLVCWWVSWSLNTQWLGQQPWRRDPPGVPEMLGEDPFQHPRVGSCLTLGLSKQTHMRTKQVA